MFSSRKLQKPLRPVGKMVGKSMGKERGITGDDEYFPRSKAEKFVEDDSLVSGIDAKYPGNASSNNGRKLDINRFMKNDGIQNNLEGNRCQEYDILLESLGVSLGKRRRDDDDQFSMQDSMAYDHELDRGLGRVIQINHPGDCMDNSERVAEEGKFSLTKHIMGSNTGPITTPKYSWESLAKVGRATDNGWFSQGDILGDKYTPDHGFGLVTSMDHLQNSAIKARRASDDRDFSADCGVENDYNLVNYPDRVTSADPPLNTLGRLRKSQERVFLENGRMESGRDADSGMGEVRKESDDGNFSRTDRVDVPSEPFAKFLNYRSRANDHEKFFARVSMENANNISSGYPVDGKRRLSDEGILKKADGLDNAYTTQSSFGLPNFPASTNLCQSRQTPTSFSSNLETNNSFRQAQPMLRPAFRPSMEQKTFDFSCPTFHDAMVTRTVPYDPEVPEFHHRNQSSLAGDCNSHSMHDFPPHQNSNGNLFAASFKQSTPYCSGEEGFGNKVPLPTSTNYYTRSGSRMSSSLLSAEYHGKMEAKTQEVYNGSLFPEATSASPPYSRRDVYERKNASPFIEFDKHGLTSPSRHEQKIPQHENSLAFGVDDASFNSNTGYWRSGLSHEKSNNREAEYYYENAKGMPTDSKSKRTSVFARLTSASEVNPQENDCDFFCRAEEESNFDLQYVECNVGASVDQVMGALHESLDHRIMKARKSSLVGKQDTECDGLKMPTLKTEYVIEVDWNDIIKETRVVSFKRRSETKKIKDMAEAKTSVDNLEREREGSVQKSGGEGSEGNRRRKLVRPVFGKKQQLDEGLSCDGSSNLQVSSSEACHKDSTGNVDDSVKSRDNENFSSPNSVLVQLTSLSGCEGNNANIKQSSNCGGKKSVNYDRKESFDGRTKRASSSNLQVSSCEGFNAKENTGSCAGLTRSHESDNIASQNVGFIHLINPTMYEAGNTISDSSDCRERTCGASLRSDGCKNGITAERLNLNLNLNLNVE